MRSIMLDCETLDTKSSAVILSIGAVEFDGVSLGRTFHRHITIDSCLDKGLTVSGNTILWWMDQPDEARRRLQAQSIDLSDVLAELEMAFQWEGTEVWANGTDFDLSIIGNAYRKCGWKNPPWAYTMGRDYRTVRKLFPRALVNYFTVEPLVEHDALEDATAQALTLMALLNSNVPLRATA